MNKQFARFMEFQGKAITAAETIGVTKARISFIMKGNPVGPKIAKKIVDKYPSIDLYELLYG